MDHHSRSFRRAGGRVEWIDGLRTDHRSLALPLRELAMLDYAAKLTREPGAMRREDVDRLRQAGLSDREILDLVMVVGYFAFANRLVDGLGVELEEWDN
ncbi:MAG TPA: peroxidase [Planctomycetota bacterium]|nr:peroxidase [Planctomycetota bacterium]